MKFTFHGDFDVADSVQSSTLPLPTGCGLANAGGW